VSYGDPYTQWLSLPKRSGGVASSPHVRARAVTAFIKLYRDALMKLYSKWDLAPIGVTQNEGAGSPIEADLEEVYQPLRMGKGYDLRKTESGRAILPNELLARDRNLVIRGAAGTGKTTWVRWTFRQLLRDPRALPIMVELRSL